MSSAMVIKNALMEAGSILNAQLIWNIYRSNSLMRSMNGTAKIAWLESRKKMKTKLRESSQAKMKMAMN